MHNHFNAMMYIGYMNFHILSSPGLIIMRIQSYPMGKMMGKGRRRPGRGIQRNVGDRFWRIERYSLEDNMAICMLLLIALLCETLTG